MDKDKYLIFIDNKNKTEEIEKVSSPNESKVKIKFYSNSTNYTYGKEKVTIFKNPKEIDATSCLVYLDGSYLSNIVKLLDFKDYIRIYYKNGKENVYEKSRIVIEKNVLADGNSKQVLGYLKELAENIDTENDFLFKQYKKIVQLSEKSILSKYLNPSKIDSFKNSSSNIFPFGFNLSQETAVSKALTNQVSIIEGPPGTGKTQTILNILANIIMEEKTVAIVSNNNAATMNVFDKLKKYDLSFISAFLGNNDNKEDFFNNQNLIYPNFADIINNDSDINKSRADIENDTNLLKEMLSAQNQIAILNQVLEELLLEKKYFLELYEKRNIKAKKYMSFFKDTSKKTLSLWADFEYIQTTNKSMSLFFKIKNLFKYGIFSFSFYKYSIDTIILSLQNTFYLLKEKELKNEISTLKKSLTEFDFENAMILHSKKSMILFKTFLSNKYQLLNKRKDFKSDSLWKDFKTFIDEYPVVLSTTHSLINCTGKNFLYDYLIIDESSQVDIVSGSLALSCAKNVIVVGDLKQLPHIVNEKSAEIVETIFNKYKINPFYHYQNNLLLSISNIFKDAPKILLKEHYRCHPKIIGFCNKKFYNNELVILTKTINENEVPLVLYKTVDGNHSRGKYNQRQIDVIRNEILPTIISDNIGIISPFRMQVNKLNKEIETNSSIEVDTVHKYQGREKNIIIITTVVDDQNEFADNLNLLNVAISRAVDKLYVVVSDDEKNKNMKDLVNYIRYNNYDIKESKIYSIFDLLYQNYAPYLNTYLNKLKKVSKYKSENLMNIVIENVLSNDEFHYLGVFLNYSLNKIIKDTNLLNDEEKTFVENPWSHIDFIIYSKINKQIVLAIEVDGWAFHENNPKQLKRDKIKDGILNKYDIPLIRFATNGSGEEEKLFKMLKNIL